MAGVAPSTEAPPTGRESFRACGHCCAYLVFRKQKPWAIEARDLEEYGWHLVARHGFSH
jgi:hypothetical protein